MLVRLYSIFDRVAGVHADPFVSVNDATATRAFVLAQSQPDSMLYASPADYQLWYLGAMDNYNGDLIVRDNVPYKVADGHPKESFSNEE